MTGGSLSEQLATIQSQLEETDGLLDAIEDDVEALVEQALANVSIDVTHDLETGKLVASIPVEEAARTLDEQIDGPYFVRVAGSRIIIGDFRTIHGDLEDEIVGFESEQKRTESVRNVIGRLETESGRAVPEETLLSMLNRLGLHADEAERALRELKAQGDVYEPLGDHYSLS